MNRILVSMQEGLSEPEWFNKVQEFESLVLQKLGYDGEEISILFCNDAFIKDLNSRFRNIDKETDILSFENGIVHVRADSDSLIVKGIVAVIAVDLSAAGSAL